MNLRIAPSGDDSNPQGPWASLEGARKALRRLRQDGRLVGFARVLVEPGRYEIHQTVEFGPEDSDVEYLAADPQDKPVFCGGRRLEGWRESVHRGCRAWILDLPEAALSRWVFRSLFVNGVRRPRARTPKFTPDASGVKNTFRIAEMRFPEKRKLFDGDHMFRPAKGDMEPWAGLGDAEVVLLHYWVETRLPSPRMDPETGWVTCSRRSVFNLYESFNPLHARYYVDGLFEALSEPGEWHLDQKVGRVIYLPMEGEELEDAVILAPVIKQMVKVRGKSYLRSPEVMEPGEVHPVEGLRFKDLIFETTDWHLPLAGMLKHDEGAASVEDIPLGSAPQAACHVPSVLSFRWASGCGLEGCVVRRTGFSAVEFGPGSEGCFMRSSHLVDIGGGGVKIEGSELDGPLWDRTRKIEVSDSVIERIGRVFHQSVGALLTTASDCEIVHNEIAHTCYTGISCGWSWGYRRTVTQNILIEGNFIHDICEGVLSDNGGIYLLGVQPGTVVRGNRIERVTAADYGGWGIYPDEGSSHILIEQNWVHATGGTSLSVHYGREIVARNNVFSEPGDCCVNVGRQEEHRSLTMMRNLFWKPKAACYSGAYRGDVRRAVCSDGNLFSVDCHSKPAAIHPDYREDAAKVVSWEMWKDAGHDRLSVFLSHKIESLEGAVDCAVRELGFTPYDWSSCGPRR